jgi:hypothetical protein
VRYLHFSVGVFFKLLYFLMVQCGGWVLASLHNPVLMRTYALGILEGVFYSKYLHNKNTLETMYKPLHTRYQPMGCRKLRDVRSSQCQEAINLSRFDPMSSSLPRFFPW